MRGLYREKILDHYANPRNYGELENPSFLFREYNPSCGDAVLVCGLVEEEVVRVLCFKSVGCVITVASASLLSEVVIGKTMADILQYTKEDIIALLDIPIGPTRLRCALLSLYALQKAITAYKKI